MRSRPAPRSARWSTRSSSTRTSHYIDIGRKEGAKLAFGGERLNRETPGFYLQPALFTDTDNEMRINREEIFGPVATVIRVERLRGGAGDRQRHAVRPVGGHLHHLAQAREPLQAQHARPAW